MYDTGFRPERPGWLKQLLSRVRTWLRQHGILVHHLSDDDLQGILARAAQAEQKKRRGTDRNGGNGDGRYSLNEFEDHTRFVDVKTNQHLFDGLSPDEAGKLAKKIIKEKFVGKVIGIDNPVFVNGQGAGEYSFPAKPIEDDDVRQAKARTAPELDNLVDAGKKLPDKPDGEDGHIHPNATGGFSYLETIFKVGNEYYKGIVNIVNIPRGRLFKDVTKIENITEAITNSYGQDPKFGCLRDVSMPTIDEENENASGETENNAKFSVSPAFENAIRQKFGSGNTSLRQVAAGFKKINFVPGTVNLDLGGGQFDEGTQYLAEKGVENLVFDPVNRDSEHNKKIFDAVRNGGVDTVTCNNVLNVIQEPEARSNVILQAAKALKPGGTAYFTVYEGDGSGNGRQSQADAWQEHRKTADYIEEIKQHFGDVSLKNKVITARNPSIDGKTSAWAMDRTFENPFRYSISPEAPVIRLEVAAVADETAGLEEKRQAALNDPARAETFYGRSFSQDFDDEWDAMPPEEQRKIINDTYDQDAEELAHENARSERSERGHALYEALENCIEQTAEYAEQLGYEIGKSNINSSATSGYLEVETPDGNEVLHLRFSDHEQPASGSFLTDKDGNSGRRKADLSTVIQDDAFDLSDVWRFLRENAGTDGYGAVRMGTEDGKRFSVRQTQTPEFKRWFKDSKVVDQDGEPMKVFHGTRGIFYTFDGAKSGSNLDFGTMGKGFYFTTDRGNAENIARNNTTGNGDPVVMECFLNIRNPKEISWDEISGDNKEAAERLTEKWKAKGYDGFVAEAPNGATWWVAFEPTQIKSATDNVGTFDSKNPDIRYSVSPVYTGSAADYDKPSLHYVGSGEGAQVYGWGLYGSSSENVARWYAETDADRKNQPKVLFDGKEQDPDWESYVNYDLPATEYEIQNQIMDDLRKAHGDFDKLLYHYESRKWDAEDHNFPEYAKWYQDVIDYVEKNRDRFEYIPRFEPEAVYLNGRMIEPDSSTGLEEDRIEHNARDGHRAEVLDAPISQRMLPVGQFSRQFRAHDRDDGRQSVGEVVDRIEDDRDGVGGEPHGGLERREENVGHDPDRAGPDNDPVTFVCERFAALFVSTHCSIFSL